MTSLPATSPYAPSGRNSFLRRTSSSSLHTLSADGGRGQGGNNRTTTMMALFLFVIRFWKDARAVDRFHSVWKSLIEVPSKRLLDAFNSLVLALPLLPPLISYNPKHDNCLRTDAKRIQENQKTIQRVMDYWFGQYPLETSQKRLWMIAASSVEHREKVDLDITRQFEDLLLELSEGCPSATVDDENHNEDFDCTSASSTSLRWREWCLDQDGIYGARGKIAAIIVLDQFSRHILRYYQSVSSSSKEEDSFPVPQSALDRLTLNSAKLLVDRHSQEIQCGMIPLPMHIFALMPFRHDNTLESVQYVQDCIEQAAGLHTQTGVMLGRFRKATNRRMAILQDEARRTGKSHQANNFAATYEASPNSGASTTSGELDAATTSFTDEDILETFPFEADLTPSINHPVHKTIVQFLADQRHDPSGKFTNCHPRDNAKIEASPSSSSPQPPAGVVVSLSGGVDSMVIASVLTYLKRSCGYDYLNIIAVHVDYANRPESGAEADFVRRYCREYLDIDFQCRRIGEVTRGITARDDYERIARTIRYDSYHEAVANARKVVGNDEIIGVMLGHHRGDLRENVLSNAHKGCGPLDLSGMTSVSKNNGIIVYRPLLPLEKSSILDYAHKFGIPYFKDTTPHWSTRGKLRNKLLPLLEEIYGDGSMNNLSILAVESDECRSLLQKSIIGPFMESVVRKPMGIIMNTVPWRDQPVFFWKFVLREALHSASLGMFSDKSVLSFLERIKAKTLKSSWIQFRKDYGVYLQDDGKVYVFYPTSFPWNKKEAYDLDGQAVDFETDNMVGPWKVRAEILEGSSFKEATQVQTDWLAKKAIASMDQLMDGKVEYFIEAPIWVNKETGCFTPRPLIFRQFSKRNRPLAWRNSDLKIQETLPLLCNDEIEANSMNDVAANRSAENQNGEEQGKLQCIIRVTLELPGSEGNKLS